MSNEIDIIKDILFFKNFCINEKIYHPDVIIRNYNRKYIAERISEYIKIFDTNYDSSFFESIIKAFDFYQFCLDENDKRIPPDFLNILYKILLRQKNNYSNFTNNINTIMMYDTVNFIKSIEEITIEDRIVNLYKN
jgi:hypothetical protein